MIIFSKKKINIAVKLYFLLINILGIFSVFSFVLIKDNNAFTDSGSMFSKLFWPVYLLSAMASFMLFLEESRDKEKAILFYITGGAAALSMLFMTFTSWWCFMMSMTACCKLASIVEAICSP